MLPPPPLFTTFLHPWRVLRVLICVYIALPEAPGAVKAEILDKTNVMLSWSALEGVLLDYQIIYYGYKDEEIARVSEYSKSTTQLHTLCDSIDQASNRERNYRWAQVHHSATRSNLVPDRKLKHRPQLHLHCKFKTVRFEAL